jgi:hypothetical protein
MKAPTFFPSLHVRPELRCLYVNGKAIRRHVEFLENALVSFVAAKDIAAQGVSDPYSYENAKAEMIGLRSVTPATFVP